MSETTGTIGALDIVAFVFAAAMVLAPLSFVMHSGALQ